MNRRPLFMIAMFLTTLFGAGTTQADKPPGILGWVEEIAIPDAGMVLRAKIDTGADHSSIHASEIYYFMRQGSTWVRFKLQGQTGTQIAMERPLIRIGQIKKKEGGVIARPVVSLGICVAGQQLEAEINLADRNHFTYPMLVGRSLMVQRFLVDPDRTYITKPFCNKNQSTTHGYTT